MRHTLLAALPIFAVLLVGCTAAKMKPVDLRNLESDESIVMGSLIIKVQDPEEPEKELGFLEGRKRKAEGYTYSIHFRKYDAGSFWRNLLYSRGVVSHEFRIETTPHKEEVFITKLPAGVYVIDQIFRRKVMFTGDWVTTNLTFSVMPGETAYWGKIVITLPYRFSGYSDVSSQSDKIDTEVEYELKKFISSMKDEYGEIILELTLPP